jgi:hypothetical protein
MEVKHMYKKVVYERKKPTPSNEKISFETPSKNNDYDETSGLESSVAVVIDL